ncbi:MAG: YajQ family cyclic di-GMP-binding protein [Gammaproteobacteria bacterium]|nr:YajQ family cyclic di-GMP-binding protein [Gammaproteobacteria bacterium]
MPSFDVVSEVDKHELSNAVDQANREVGQRFDFKGSKARVERDEYKLTIIADGEFQAKQLLEILQTRLAKRGIDIDCLEVGDFASNIAETRLPVTVREGVDADTGRKLNKLIKDSKIKVTSQMQQNQLRVTGKNRDDLQAVIALIRNAKLGVPFQFTNFRD